MPLSCAIHARPNSTASERRRSSAQPRRLERFRSRWTQGRGRSDRATKKTIRAHAGDEQAASSGVGGPAGLEHERNGEDRCHVGDRDLGDHDQRLWAVELSFLQHRQHDRRRARGQKDGIHGDMAGPRQLGHDQATERRSDRDHARRQRATAPGGIEQQLGHDPSSGVGDAPEPALRHERCARRPTTVVCTGPAPRPGRDLNPRRRPMQQRVLHPTTDAGSSPAHGRR